MPSPSAACWLHAALAPLKSNRTTSPMKIQPRCRLRSLRRGLLSKPIRHLFEEKRIKVRSVNCNMTERACLILLRLVMKSRCGRSAGVDCERVALQAHQVHLAALQQARVGRTVRSMAGNASFGLDRRMFMNKWPCFLRMAFETDGILGRCRPQLTGLEPAVRIVTITALHHAFVDAVVKGTVELLFGFQMATVAKLRLLLFH